MAVPTTLLVFRESKIAALKLVTTFAVLFGLLIGYSRAEFGTWLPDYYATYTYTAHGFSFKAWKSALYGLLFSPGRGLFVYQPLLLIVVLGAAFAFHRLRKDSLFWWAMTWIILNLLVLSRWPMWSGGGGFGSRLLVENFPAWILLNTLLWWTLRESRHLAAVSIIYGVLVALGGFMHSYQALHNWSTWDWNGTPGSLSSDNRNLFDWRHPQFLARPKMISELGGQNTQ